MYNRYDSIELPRSNSSSSSVFRGVVHTSISEWLFSDPATRWPWRQTISSSSFDSCHSPCAEIDLRIHIGCFTRNHREVEGITILDGVFELGLRKREKVRWVAVSLGLGISNFRRVFRQIFDPLGFAQWPIIAKSRTSLKNSTSSSSQSSRKRYRLRSRAIFRGPLGSWWFWRSYAKKIVFQRSRDQDTSTGSRNNIPARRCLSSPAMLSPTLTIDRDSVYTTRRTKITALSYSITTKIRRGNIMYFWSIGRA